VANAVSFAQEAGLEISVRGGAHNFGGAAVGDDGLTIDLSGICQVTVDPDSRTARVGGGATLAQLDAATQAHGLATPGGTVSHTGVGGLTLGGGFGWLTPQYGLSCDNLLSAKVVTADSQVLRASADQHPDLFWALRGGGGNFGVVTEFEFQLHPVGPLAQAALFFWKLDDGEAALALAQQVTTDLPPRMGALAGGVNAMPLPFVPEEYHFRPGIMLIVAAFGADAEHARLVDQIRSALTPLFEIVTPIPYTALQQILDQAAPWGIQAYEKSLYLDALSPEVISTITAAARVQAVANVGGTRQPNERRLLPRPR
jgi:FAD/FMN-containing dehydrogenase